MVRLVRLYQYQVFIFVMEQKGEFFCHGCGRKFPLFQDCSRTQCFQCEKVEAAGDNHIAIEEIEKIPMCTGCGLLLRRLKGETCDICSEILSGRISHDGQNSRRGGITNKSGVKEPRGPAKMRMLKQRQPAAATMSDPIEIDSDNSDSAILTKMEHDDASTLLRSQIEKKKKVASQIRLTHKDPSTSSDLPGATKQYLKKKASQQGTSVKVSNITFRIHVGIQHKDGRTKGTPVPFQTKTFQTDNEMSEVFEGIVNIFNESKGKWLQNYPGKILTTDIVHFTFLNGSDIAPRYMSGPLRLFWNAHTMKKGIHLKPSEISEEMVSLKMLVPVAYAVGSDDSDSEAEDEPKPAKGKAKASRSTRNIKREANEDPELKTQRSHSKRIKAEPAEENTDMFALDNDEHNGATPADIEQERHSNDNDLLVPQMGRFKLTRPVTFMKEILKNGKEFEQVTELFTGNISCMAEHLKVKGKTFFAHLLKNTNARFDAELDLDLARTELLRQQFLSSVVNLYVNGESRPDIVCLVLETFIAIIKDKRSDVTDVYVCQLEFPLEKSTVSISPLISEAIAHHSFVESNGEKVISDIRSEHPFRGDFKLQPLTFHAVGTQALVLVMKA
ncbi:hypothetical protein F5880DRAFT_1510802 [Lentinula raphanica]|nr:hypothetical protein F5880DRAFT_1510802 [Lentinula raphanica]